MLRESSFDLLLFCVDTHTTVLPLKACRQAADWDFKRSICPY